MKNFRTYELAVRFYERAKSLKLKGVLQNQYDRALLSIVLNLAEGSSRPSKKERRRFYLIAFGSFREVQALLRLTRQESLLSESDSLGAHLYCLCNSVVDHLSTAHRLTETETTATSGQDKSGKDSST